MFEGKPCETFLMDDPEDAFNHLFFHKRVIEYGDKKYGNYLHVWDCGNRALCQCDACGGFFLRQYSEFHGRDDAYYTDYFPVNGK